MRTQPPTSPFDVVGVEMARYGKPQHETAVSSSDTFYYGPPQHEQHVEDPDWLISIARRSFSINTMEPVGEPETESESEPEPKAIEERPRERAVIRQ